MSELELENYSVAAFRHWRDAQLLERENRLDNGDQLYGIAAECAIKEALIKLPAFAMAGILDEPFKRHINELWGKVSHQSLQKRYSALCAILKIPNPFLNWHIDQRYAADGVVSKEVMQIHRDVARRLLGAVGLNGQRK